MQCEFEMACHRMQNKRNEPDKENDDEDIKKDFQIPKTMRVIYQISNRNCRNKNVPSLPNTERSRIKTEPMAVDSLEGTEAILATSGYYVSMKQL